MRAESAKSRGAQNLALASNLNLSSARPADEMLTAEMNTANMDS